MFYWRQMQRLEFCSHKPQNGRGYHKLEEEWKGHFLEVSEWPGPVNTLIFLFFLYSRFLLVIYFIHISVYMSIPISQFIPPPPPLPHFPPLGSMHLFSTSVSLFLPCKLVHLYHFSRFHIYALIYICFSLSDLLHSVWQSPDPSMSLQTTQFCSFFMAE